MKSNIVNYPKYLSFVGVDESTNLDDLSNFIKYRECEVGVLISGKYNVKNRYPSLEFIKEFANLAGTHRLKYARSAWAARLTTFSIHLCGDYAKRYCNNELSLDEHKLLSNFDTVQINRLAYDYDSLLKSNTPYNKVVQFRGDFFPCKSDLTYLIDRSGGKGIPLDNFPYLHDEQLVGVAGGLNIDTVENIVLNCPYKEYYLDMESGIRTDDNFDIDKCEKIYNKVYSQ